MKLFTIWREKSALPDVSTNKHKLRFWTLWKNQISRFLAVVQSNLPAWETLHIRGRPQIYPLIHGYQPLILEKVTWTRSAISAPMLSYFWAIDITRRTLLIASFSLAREHWINFDCKSAREILKESAICSSEGSQPNLSFSLKFPNPNR